MAGRVDGRIAMRIHTKQTPENSGGGLQTPLKQSKRACNASSRVTTECGRRADEILWHVRKAGELPEGQGLERPGLAGPDVVNGLGGDSKLCGQLLGGC